MSDMGKQSFVPAAAVGEEIGELRTSFVVSENALGSENARHPIGHVREIAGSSSAIALDLGRLEQCSTDLDPSVALSGKVGSQIKIRVGNSWLLASVRTQRQDTSVDGGVVAQIDFLGEGEEERLTGKIYGFRRGVTRYPVPGALVYPATSNDLRQIYASDGRTNISIGTEIGRAHV